jgi:hypothetical protein
LGSWWGKRSSAFAFNFKTNSRCSSRARTELELVCSKATVIRLEQDGKLKPVKLRKNGRVFHRIEDVQALIEGGTYPPSEKHTSGRSTSKEAGHNFACEPKT